MFILILIIITITIIISRYFYDKYNRNKINETLKDIYMKSCVRFENNEKRDKLPKIDQVYCITMPHRRKYAENILNTFDINVTYFDAIKIEDLTEENYNILSETFNSNNKLMYKKKTKLPVHLSYTMCLMNALINGYENIIIFEDDITRNVTKNKLINSIKEFIDSDFIMFYMGYCWLKCNQNVDKKQYKYIVDVPNKQLLCKHAIVLKTKYFQELIDFTYPMKEYSDKSFVRFFKSKDYKICVPKRPYFYQNRQQFISFNGNNNQYLPTCKF